MLKKKKHNVITGPNIVSVLYCNIILSFSVQIFYLKKQTWFLVWFYSRQRLYESIKNYYNEKKSNKATLI